MQKIYDFIDAHEGAFLDGLFELVRIPSVSPLPGYEENIQACAEKFSQLMEACGLKTAIYPTAHNPVVYGEGPQVPGRPTILIYGHYDVQPEGDLSEWHSDPYEPVIRDGRIYGRGVGDNKGQIYAHIKAYEAYCAVKGAPDVNLKYLVEGEEEIGSVDLADFVSSHLDLLKADITIWSDSNIHASGKPVLILGLKGISSLKVTVRGPESDVHSQWGSVLPNPVWKLVEILHALKDENGKVAVPGFYDDLRRPTERELQEIRKIPPDLTPFAELWNSPDFDGSMDAVEFFTKFMYEPTVNIGCITAGNVTGTKNIVPHEAACWIDMRLGPGQDSKKKREAVTAFITALGGKSVSVEGTGSDAAFTDIDNPFVDPVAKIVKELWGQEPLIYPGLGGSGPFTVFNQILKAPCIFVPFADAQQHDHGPDESVPAELLLRGCKIGAAMIDRFASVAV